MSRSAYIKASAGFVATVVAAVAMYPSSTRPCNTKTAMAAQAKSLQENSRPFRPKDIRPAGASDQARVLKQFAQLPLYFEPNLGQTDAQVQFLARVGGYTLFLTPGEAVMVLSRSERRDRDWLRRHRHPPKTEQEVVRMKLEGAAASAPAAGMERQPGISAYFIGDDPAKWRPEVPHYARVEYKQVYPGIDLVYYGDRRQVEYDFVVTPGADPGRIQLAYQGAAGLRVAESGDLVLATRVGELKQRKPRVWQQIGARRVEVAASYRLTGRRVGVELAFYDRKWPLVIDPALNYSTYLGGGSVDEPKAIAVDAAGAAYVAGDTNSTDFPIANGYQTSFAGGTYDDAFVTKLNAYGGSGSVTLAYSTYLGGSAHDAANAIAVDAAGAAYVAGYTASTNFPTANAYKSSYLGGFDGSDAFVAKLNAYGASGPVTLAYSTYLGGDLGDSASAIAVDAAGAAYVAGYTSSANFPNFHPYQAKLGGFDDAFVTKLNAFGGSGSVTLAYSTYLGGSGDDSAYAIAVDAAGAAYVAGATTCGAGMGVASCESTNFPTVNAYQAAYGGGPSDAFVTKLNAYGGSGSVTLAYSTYLGGSGSDSAYAIGVDAAGAAYVAGATTSTNFPAVNAYQAAYGGGPSDAFAAKLNTYGGSGPVTPAYSTYIGGKGTDHASAIAVDAAGAAYVAGYTDSTNFPTANPYQTSLDGGFDDAFVTKLNAYGGSGAVTLACSTYLGGSGIDMAFAIAVDAADAAYVAGTTTSRDFPAANPYQAGYRGGIYDAFVTKIDLGGAGPVLTGDGVVNAASYAHGVAPGEIVTLYGINLGPSTGVPNAGYDPITSALPTTLGEVSVSFDSRAASLFYVRSDQINVQVPYEVAGRSATSIVVSYRGAPSAAVSVPVADASPGIFAYNGRVLVLNAITGAVVDAAHPISRGGWVTIYGTGSGLVDPPVATGKPAPLTPLSRARGVSVSIGGRFTTVDFAGMAPGLVGLLQINLQIPPDVPTGTDVPLELYVNYRAAQAFVGGAPTAALTIAIQ